MDKSIPAGGSLVVARRGLSASHINLVRSVARLQKLLWLAFICYLLLKLSSIALPEPMLLLTALALVWMALSESLGPVSMELRASKAPALTEPDRRWASRRRTRPGTRRRGGRSALGT